MNVSRWVDKKEYLSHVNSSLAEIDNKAANNAKIPYRYIICNM